MELLMNSEGIDPVFEHNCCDIIKSNVFIPVMTSH